MQLYAENLTPSLGGVNSDASGGYNDFSYGTMAEPMPGVILIQRLEAYMEKNISWHPIRRFKETSRGMPSIMLRFP